MIVGSGVTSALLGALPTLGVPLILLLFYLDGMVVGKVLPPAALFVAWVALAGPESSTLVIVSGASVVAATLGQWTLYRGFNEESPEFFGVRRRVPYVDRIPAVVHTRVGPRRMAFVSRTFNRFGGASLCVVNGIPGIRSLMAIPAGLSRYPVGRFLLFSAVGNTLYLVLLVGVALGIVEAAGIIPTP